MTQNRFVVLFFSNFLFLCLPSFPSGIPNKNVPSIIPSSVANTPAADTPLRLREVWLRFHRDNLCEKVDAAFLFHKSEMEVLVNIENGKNNRKLFEILEPLHDSYQIKLHTVRLQTERELIDIRNAPPSFWLNSKLTEYLRDDFLRDAAVIDRGLQTHSTDWTTDWTPTLMFRQRILLFARDTLDYNRKVRLFAAHLPLLARAAFDPQYTPDLSNQALDVCRAHAKKLEKYIKKLYGNLTKALPNAPEKSNEAPPSEAPIMTAESAVHIAIRLDNEAQNLFHLVYRFIYPQTHTVELDDLLNPSLLQSLKALRKTTVEFQRSID